MLSAKRRLFTDADGSRVSIAIIRVCDSVIQLILSVCVCVCVCLSARKNKTA